MREGMMSAQTLDDWCLQYKPSRLTILNLKTGQQLQEPSLVAAKYRLEERTGTNRATGETRTLLIPADGAAVLLRHQQVQKIPQHAGGKARGIGVDKHKQGLREPAFAMWTLPRAW